MSVLKSKRGESAMQFIETARELEIYTIKQCAKFPKRFMFLITKDLVELTKTIYNNAKSANSIYPTNTNELEMRRKLKTFKRWQIEGKMTIADIKTSYVSWKGHLKHCNAWQTLINTDVLFNKLFNGG